MTVRIADDFPAIAARWRQLRNERSRLELTLPPGFAILTSYSLKVPTRDSYDVVFAFSDDVLTLLKAADIERANQFIVQLGRVLPSARAVPSGRHHAISLSPEDAAKLRYWLAVQATK